MSHFNIDDMDQVLVRNSVNPEVLNLVWKYPIYHYHNPNSLSRIQFYNVSSEQIDSKQPRHEWGK